MRGSKRDVFEQSNHLFLYPASSWTLCKYPSVFPSSPVNVTVNPNTLSKTKNTRLFTSLIVVVSSARYLYLPRPPPPLQPVICTLSPNVISILSPTSSEVWINNLTKSFHTWHEEVTFSGLCICSLSLSLSLCVSRSLYPMLNSAPQIYSSLLRKIVSTTEICLHLPQKRRI